MRKISPLRRVDVQCALHIQNQNSIQLQSLFIEKVFFLKHCSPGRPSCLDSTHFFPRFQHLFRQWTILDGSTIGGRFGLSLAKLGDLDRDGYDDLAVGAPYDQQGGSVFIFRGGPNGIDEKPSQIIAGKDVDPRLQGFGYSLSGNVDLDGNGYPDFLVGAPFSGQSVYFR